MTISTEIETTGAEQVHWDLTHLYQGDARKGVEADLDAGMELALEFETKYRGRVAGLPASELADALRDLEGIEDILARAAGYTQLSYSTDVTDPVRGALLQKVQEAGTQVATHMLFFNLEWIAVPDDVADALVADPVLSNYRHHLVSARRYRPYVLSEPEEKVLAEKSVTARAAWDRLFEDETTALRVKTREGDEITLDSALSVMQGEDREQRAAISQSITEALRLHLPTRRFILNTILADKSIDDRLRGYPHWLADRNLANEASDGSVTALIDAVTSRYDVPQRYYALKKKLLRIDHFHEYDRYAPVGAPEPRVPWEEAREIVLDAYGSFSPRFRDLAEEFFDKRWIDAATAPTKRNGAFAHPVAPSVHPYVLVNYTGKRRDVLVLAHELGHGVHMSLSRAQTPLNFGTPLTTAETASIFGETVTFDRLLSAEKDPQRRLSLMIGRIDDAVASIFRQVAMNRFEDLIHNHRRDVGELSEEEIEKAWMDTQTAMLGPAVELTSNYSTWWSYIPHFIGVPGYVYAYAFGNLLALAIYERAKEEGPGFAPRYFDLLAAGGSESPEALTRKIGVDLADPGFWQGGLKIVADLVEEAEELSRQV
jgi:oligoendopeptidase F